MQIKASSIQKPLIISLCLISGFLILPIKTHALSSALQPESSTPAAESNTIPIPVTYQNELNVQIPGLQFASQIEEKSGKLQIPFIAQYIAAFYNYIIGASIIAAAIMVTYGGFLYITGATISSASTGKTIITDAVLGLILVLGASTILSIVSPSTLSLAPLSIKKINKAPEQDWLDTYGTAGLNSQGVLEKIFSESPGATAASQASSGGSNGQPSGPQPTFKPEDLVSIANIPFDKSKGGPANLALYKPTPQEIKAATTYDDKIKLLVKVVLGFHKVCVQNQLCAYCQAGYTSDNGSIQCIPNPSDAVNFMESHGLDTGNHIWSSSDKCQEIWTGGSEDAKGKKLSKRAVDDPSYGCADAARSAFQENVTKKMEEAKMYATDCGGFVWTLYGRTGAKYIRPPLEPKNGQYYSQKSLGKFEDRPDFIVGATQDTNLLALAAPKGGFKFGDAVYTHYDGTGLTASHWSLYTGGRPDVPFSWIEMGNSPPGANVPGVGQMSGVSVRSNQTIPESINAKLQPTVSYYLGKNKPTVIPAKFKQSDLKNAIIFVFRPFADETSNK